MTAFASELALCQSVLSQLRAELVAIERTFPELSPEQSHRVDRSGGGASGSITSALTCNKNGKKPTHDNVIHRFTFTNAKIIEWRGTGEMADPPKHAWMSDGTPPAEQSLRRKKGVPEKKGTLRLS